MPSLAIGNQNMRDINIYLLSQGLRDTDIYLVSQGLGNQEGKIFSKKTEKKKLAIHNGERSEKAARPVHNGPG